MGTQGLGPAVQAMHRALGGSHTLIYGVRPSEAPDEVALDFADIEGFPTARFRTLYDETLRGHGVHFHAYNPLRPAPGQRNRVLATAQLFVPGGSPPPSQTHLYPRVGAAGYETLRVLVCDRSSLLGWAGILQPSVPTLTQRDALQRMLPALRARLTFERQARRSAGYVAAFEAALEEIGRAAYLLGPGGRVLHANALGRFEAPARNGDMVAAWKRNHPGYGSSLVRESSGREWVLAVAKGTTGGTSISGAALGLTAAQTKVFQLIADGLSNATIAAELGIAERTVEAHITAILAKADVPSRSALLASLLAAK
jgi:DNA-binding CsgD family transcriptional regulator